MKEVVFRQASKEEKQQANFSAVVKFSASLYFVAQEFTMGQMNLQSVKNTLFWLRISFWDFITPVHIYVDMINVLMFQKELFTWIAVYAIWFDMLYHLQSYNGKQLDIADLKRRENDCTFLWSTIGISCH